MPRKARRRLLSLANQLNLLPKSCAGLGLTKPKEPMARPVTTPEQIAQARAAATEAEIFGPQVGLFSVNFTKPGEADPLSEARLKELFGPAATFEGPLGKTGIGRRYHNVDLSRPLSPAQAAYVVDSLSVHALISFAGQDMSRFSLARFERLANHFGAVQPMYADIEADEHGYKDRERRPLETMNRNRANVNASFPGQLEHLPDGSPAIATVTNVTPPKGGKEGRVTGGGSFHTDQDHERISCTATMFLVHKTPSARDPETGTWLKTWPKQTPSIVDKHLTERSKLPNAPPELQKLREEMPMNGETAYADTAAAFAALPKEEQEKLEKMVLVKYKQEGDDVLGRGYRCPLVRTNPRSGKKAIYSPVYGGRNFTFGIPPTDIEGMTKDEAKAFLDRLEQHCIQPQFRYDHLHREGDFVVWDDYALLHSAPPVKIGITKLEDARLYYRIATKGRPELTLPRKDTTEWLMENFTSDYRTPPEIVNADSD